MGISRWDSLNKLIERKTWLLKPGTTIYCDESWVDTKVTEAKTILGKARAKAETLTAEAKKKADEQIEQG